MRREIKILAVFAAVFVTAYFLPLADARISGAILAAFKMVQWYARNHTLACVVPALFIAGAITTFLSPAAVLKHLGPLAKKIEAYSVASVSGCILAVCSCSVLPMFAGIYRIGAGLGPAATFLYAGPAINVMALFLTARVLGVEIGVARAVGAIVFGVVIGIMMAVIYRRDETARSAQVAPVLGDEDAGRPLWKTGALFACLLAFLVFSDWFNPGDVRVHRRQGAPIEGVLLQETRDEIVVQLSQAVEGHDAQEQVTLSKATVSAIDREDSWVIRIHRLRWYLAGLMGLSVLLMAWRWMSGSEVREWMRHTWDFTKLLVPLLFGGVFLVGFLGALLPEGEVAKLVGDNSLLSNLLASVIGALFYFATLTEVPILEALMKHGMHEGPALALLLAGPALSLPSLLVIRSVIGLQKTLVFTGLVVAMATVAGVLNGSLV